MIARTRPRLAHRALWLALLWGFAPGFVRAEPTLGGRPALWQPQKPTPLAIKVHSVELGFEAAAQAFSVYARTELVLPEEAQSGNASATLALVEHPCDDHSELDESCDPQRLAFAPLTASIGERVQPLEKSRPAGDAPGAWLLPVKLKKGEPLAVEQRYRVPAVESGERGYGVAYLLRGASGWSKPLGRLTLKLSLPAYTCLVVEPQELPRKSRRVVLRDDALWLELVYEAYQYTPRRDFELYFEPCVIPRDTEQTGCSASALLARKFYAPQEGEEATPVADAELDAALAALPAAELTACRDAVFGAYAAYYSEDELRRLPAQPQASRSYTAPLLTAADWAWVHYLDARIAERKPAAPAAPAPAPPAPPAAKSCSCQAPGAPAPGALAWGAPWLLLLVRRRFRSRSG